MGVIKITLTIIKEIVIISIQEKKGRLWKNLLKGAYKMKE